MALSLLDWKNRVSSLSPTEQCDFCSSWVVGLVPFCSKSDESKRKWICAACLAGMVGIEPKLDKASEIIRAGDNISYSWRCDNCTRTFTGISEDEVTKQAYSHREHKHNKSKSDRPALKIEKHIVPVEKILAAL